MRPPLTASTEVQIGALEKGPAKDSRRGSSDDSVILVWVGLNFFQSLLSATGASKPVAIRRLLGIICLPGASRSVKCLCVSTSPQGLDKQRTLTIFFA